MFKNFCKYFNVNEPTDLKTGDQSMTGLVELMRAFSGRSFNRGMYRIHAFNDMEKWNDNIIQAFPKYKGKIACFGYDWLGRQFALDRYSAEYGRNQIFMFEPGTAEVLSIPCSVIQFHEEEIPENHDSCLASAFFHEWISKNPTGLKNNECAGYNVMLFLGGTDTIQNLEKSDIDVYWSVCSQLIQKMRTM